MHLSDCFSLHKAGIRDINYSKRSTIKEEGGVGTLLIFQPIVFVFVGNFHSSQGKH